MQRAQPCRGGPRRRGCICPQEHKSKMQEFKHECSTKPELGQLIIPRTPGVKQVRHNAGKHRGKPIKQTGKQEDKPKSKQEKVPGRSTGPARN